MPSFRGRPATRARRSTVVDTRAGVLEPLEPRLLFTAVPLITEFLASNDNGLADEDGDSSDWIELYNAGDTVLNLDGWHLTDDSGDLTRWTFPDVSLAAGEYLVVFASDKDRADADGTELHTNFKLGAGGEYLALVEPDGVSVAHAFAPQYPAQVEDVSYGLGGGAEALSLLDAAGAYRYHLPGGGGLGLSWTQPGFNDAGWAVGSGGLGYETSGNDFAPILETVLPAGTGGVYTRGAFNVTDPDSLSTLTLGLRYDDGFVAYLNGERVADHNAPASPVYNSVATDATTDNLAVQFRSFDLTPHRDHLVVGTNVLSIHGLNRLPSSDMLLQSELSATVGAAVDPASFAYFATPTPGFANGVPLTTGPVIGDVERSVQQPTSGQNVVVTADVTGIAGVEGVLLQYQVVEPGSYIRLTDAAYETSWVSLVMRDDGLGADDIAGDGVYSKSIPGTVQQHRRLVRYRVVAEDAAGNTSQAPIALDPQPNAAYFVYDGVPDWTGADRPGVTAPVTYGGDVLNSLPVYHLIANASDVTNSQYNGAFNGQDFLGTFVYNGVVYDHIEFKNRGQNSTYVSGKNKWKIKFNEGHAFQWHDDFGNAYGTPLREVNLGAANSPWAPGNRGLAGMDEVIAFRLFNLAGVPAPFTQTAHFRVIDNASEQGATQYDSDLWGLYIAFEDTSGRFLDAHDLSRDGDLYRLQSGNSRFLHQGSGTPGDLSAFHAFTNGGFNAYNRNGGQSEAWWRANVNLDSYYSYRAVLEALNHNDIRDLENANLYFDPNTNQWTMLPWDLDLLYEQFDRWGPDGLQSASALEKFRNALTHTAINREFQARARELQDLLLNDEQIGLIVDEYADYVEPFAAVDHAMWDYHPRTTSSHTGVFYDDNYVYSGSAVHPGVHGQVRGLTSPDHAGMVQYVKTFLSQSGFGGGQLAVLADDPQIPDTPSLTHIGPAGFAANQLGFNASSFGGNASFAGMQWRLAEVTDPGAPAYDPDARPLYEIDAVWESGTLTAFDPAFTVPFDQVQSGHAYRLRVRVQDATGRWSHWSDAQQFVVTDATASTSPIRISELHYNPQGPSPAELAAGFDDGDEFEFVELLNTSATESVNLNGYRFLRTTVNGDNEGIDFTFGNTTLAPGERVVVVENLAAFVERYGSGIRIAGQYGGKLADGGETLRLTDAGGATIHQFVYDDASPWPVAADGDGPSLVVLDTEGDYASGGNWAVSATTHGTPGAGEAQDVLGDITGDGFVGADDLDALLALWGDAASSSPQAEAADLDHSGTVGGGDLAIVINHFGQGIAPTRPTSNGEAPGSPGAIDGAAGDGMDVAGGGIDGHPGTDGTEATQADTATPPGRHPEPDASVESGHAAGADVPGPSREAASDTLPASRQDDARRAALASRRPDALALARPIGPKRPDNPHADVSPARPPRFTALKSKS